MLKTIGWVLAAVIVIGWISGTMNSGTNSTTPSSARTESASSRSDLFYAHGTVNIRSGPSTEHDVVGQLTVGDEIKVARGSDKWRQAVGGAYAGAYVYTPVLSKLSLADLEQAAANSERAEECRKKLEEAAKQRIIRDMGVSGGGAEIVVDGDVWRQVDYTTKIGLVKTVSCLLLEGDTNNQIPVTVRDHRTNKILGEGYPGNYSIK